MPSQVELQPIGMVENPGTDSLTLFIMVVVFTGIIAAIVPFILW